MLLCMYVYFFKKSKVKYAQILQKEPGSRKGTPASSAGDYGLDMMA